MTMTRPLVEWQHVRRIWLEILRREAPYFVGALAIASVAAVTFGLRLVWLGAMLGLPLAILGPARALRGALAREYSGFRITVIELQGKRETMVSRSARRRAQEWAERLGIPPSPEPPPDTERPEVETIIDRERTGRIYLVSQLWEAVLVFGGGLLLAIPLSVLAYLTGSSWSSAWSLALAALWLALSLASSAWAFRRALETIYPDFRLQIVATEPASLEAGALPARDLPDLEAETGLSSTP
jgi:hypothetical protein